MPWYNPTTWEPSTWGDAVGDWADSDFGVLDVAIPFYGATHALAKGGKAAANAAGAGIGGGGDTEAYAGPGSPIYQYGGDPNNPNPVAAGAVGNALGTGAASIGYGDAAAGLGNDVVGVGENLLGDRTNDARRFRDRAAQQGNFGAQNQSLYQLGGLEATQGPSAAQAQLQSGTNQAMAAQLALGRSGRGLGSNAAAMGLAQGNMAGIQGNQATSAAMLRAQEDAAWRQRQGQNLTNIAGMQGQQAQANLGAAVQGRSQNDAAQLAALGLGQDAFFNGVGAGMQGYAAGMQGVQGSLAGQGLANSIREQEMQGNQAYADARLRAWAAEQGYDLQQQQMSDQKDAATISAVSSGVATYGGGGRGGR